MPSDGMRERRAAAIARCCVDKDKWNAGRPEVIQNSVVVPLLWRAGATMIPAMQCICSVGEKSTLPGSDCRVASGRH